MTVDQGQERVSQQGEEEERALHSHPSIAGLDVSHATKVNGGH